MIPAVALVVPHARNSGFQERVVRSGPRFFFRMNSAPGATTEKYVNASTYLAPNPSVFYGSAGTDYVLGQTGFVRGGKSIQFNAGGRFGTAAQMQAYSGFDPSNWSGQFTLQVAFNAASSGHGGFPVIIGKILYYAILVSDFPVSLRWDHTNQRVILRLDSGNDYSADSDINSATLAHSTDYICHVVQRGTGTNQVEIWINGSISATGTYAGALASGSNTDWTVGGGTPYFVTAADSGFKGRCAEPALWNYALAPSVIQEIYASRND